ncbi:hypothetical protein [Paenibacillus sp. NPDC057967]|uniref:hypothetical protein n=1 Tax=Paenibacillus sp. NPDC057967 TaxID=3346293 RepID=UPI0036DD4B07
MSYYLISTVKYDIAPAAEDIAYLESEYGDYVFVHEGQELSGGQGGITIETPNIVNLIGETLYVYMVLETQDGKLHYVGNPEEPFSFKVQIEA